MTDISVILTAHHQGLLAGPSLASMAAASDDARQHGLSVEVIAVLDRADPLTRDMLAGAAQPDWQLIETEFSDIALARNGGVAEATGHFVAFLDADDLWGYNWLTAAHHFCRDLEQPTIVHAEVVVFFGDSRTIVWQPDSTEAGFDPGFLRIGNYWDALCFLPRRIALDHPFVANDLAAGYGHEDWHWNCLTLAAGIHHRPAPGTVHIKRRRGGSQSARCAERDAIPWPAATQLYSWADEWAARTPPGVPRPAPLRKRG